MNKKDLIKKIEEVFSNSENGKLSRETFTKDENGNTISSEVKVYVKDEEKPLIMDKKWNYNDDGKLISITGMIRPEETPKMMGKAKSEDANPIYEPNIISEWDYDDYGRLIFSHVGKESHKLSYTSENEYVDTTIDSTSGIIKTSTFINDQLVSESIGDSMNSRMTVTTYNKTENDIRYRIIKQLTNGKLDFNMSIDETYDKNLDVYIVNLKTVTIITDSVKTYKIELIDSYNDTLEWSISEDNDKDMYRIRFYQNNLTYLKCINHALIPVFEMNNVLHTTPGIRTTEYKVLNNTVQIPDDLFIYTWIFSSTIPYNNTKVIHDKTFTLTRIPGLNLDIRYDSDDCTYRANVIVKDNDKYICTGINLESSDVKLGYDGQSIIITVKENETVELHVTLDSNTANSFIAYVLEDLKLLANFNRILLRP